MSVYKPIDCNFYDILESLATKKRYVRIPYKTALQEFHTGDALIKDLYINPGFEYMVLGNGQEVRLDYLISVDGHYLPGTGFDDLSCECA